MYIYFRNKINIFILDKKLIKLKILKTSKVYIIKYIKLLKYLKVYISYIY